MLNFGKFILLAVICCFSGLFAFSQTSVPSPLPTPANVSDRIRSDDDIIERSRDLQRVEREYLRAKQESLIRERNAPPKSLSKAEREELKKILAPDADDLAAYKTFLKQSNTGIFRLFPDLGCDAKMVVRVDNECSGLISYKWSYSFRQKDYGDESFYDLRLKDGKFFGDGFMTQGVLTNLGDVALEQVSLAHDGVKYLAALTPETRSGEAKRQAAEFAKGFKENGYFYAKNAAVLENTTYAMRVVAYRIEDKYYDDLWRDSVNAEVMKYLMLFADKRTDLILAFRVAGKAPNGSLTLVWKILEKKNAPRLIFSKNEKLSDINAPRAGK